MTALIMWLLMQVPDSTVVDIPAQVGTYVSAWVAAALGAVTKFLVTATLKVLNLNDSAPALVKSLVALGYSFLVTWAAGALASAGVPGLPADLHGLSLWVGTAIVWLVSMGWHSLIQHLPVPKALK